MPEYPEVQALAERLQEAFGGSTLDGIEPLHFTALKTVDPPPESLLGRSLEGVGRRGKWLVFRFDGPRLLLHLSQGGRVTLEDPPKRSRPRDGVVRLRFGDHPSLLVREFGSERRAGWWVMAPGDEGPLAKLGPEATSEEFPHLLRTGRDRRRLHTMLRDQRTVAGIGRGYADDILHRARLSPFASLASLDEERREGLVAAVREVLAEAPAVRYQCPMHPSYVSDRPGDCPICGMKLVPADLVSDGRHEHGHGHHAHGESHDLPQGIEWEDDMVDVNRMTTPANTRWRLVDRATGAVGGAIAWRFRVGDRVKIRLVNEMDSDHPMHHPFHVHGAGRFLILSRDGIPEPNLCWKDTVLIPTGQTVDILLEVTNPGRWMAHCHIAEHHESGMMFSFDVDP